MNSLRNIFIKGFFLFFFFSAVLSGCSLPFFSDKTQEQSIIYIELEGTVKNDAKDMFSFSDYFLYDSAQKKIAHLESSTEDLSLFEKKKVILKGKRKEISADISSVLWLEVVQIAELPFQEEKISSQALGVSFFLPENFTGEEKNMRLQIEKDEESFFTVFIQDNAEWEKKFLEEGEKIVIKNFSVYRFLIGDKVKIFFPEQNIQVDFWGKSDQQYQFYEILETLEFFEKTLSSDTNNKEKEDQDNSEKDTNDTENTASKKVIDAVEKSLDELFEQSLSKKKLALYKNFVDAEFIHKEEKKRIVFSYNISEAGVIELIQVASYKEGEIQSWELESGENPQLAGESEIFLIDIADRKPIVLPENFALYMSTHFDFQIGYPKRMYYRSVGKTENSLASVEWSSSPVNAENVEILLEIIEGKQLEETILDTGNIVFPRNEKTYFKISSLTGDIELIQEMKKSFQSIL